MKAYPFMSTTTMRQNCGGSLMFNMYLSGSLHCLFMDKMKNIAEIIGREKGDARALCVHAAHHCGMTFPSGTHVLFCRKSDILFPGRAS